jgi:hypothetical protein
LAEKHMKKWSTFLAKKNMQITITLRFYLIPVRMAVIKNTNIKTNVGKDVGGKGTLMH